MIERLSGAAPIGDRRPFTILPATGQKMAQDCDSYNSSQAAALAPEMAFSWKLSAARTGRLGCAVDGQVQSGTPLLKSFTSS